MSIITSIYSHHWTWAATQLPLSFSLIPSKKLPPCHLSGSLVILLFAVTVPCEVIMRGWVAPNDIIPFCDVTNLLKMKF